jgi:lysophospholipase L1-like esterase
VTAVVRGGRTRRLALFALILALQFAMFEAALRTWGSSEAAPAFQGLFADDPVIGYRPKPGARVRYSTVEFDTQLAINQLGVRDDEEVGPKPANEKRILILGDSLVLAVQVPFRATFGELLEDRLNASSNGAVYRVINGGVQGYGPVQELLFFRSIVAAVQPDLVIATLFVGNDAEDAVTAEGRLRGDDGTSTAAVHEALMTRVRRMVRRSMVLQVLRLRVVAATSRFVRTAGPPEPPLQSYAAHPAARVAHGLSITREVVEKIAAEGAARAGARTAVMLMPARFQVDDFDYANLKDAVSQAGGELVRDAATERFAAALDGLGVPIFDALPPLKRALPGPRVFFEHTVHLTPRGHQIVAAALDQFVRESDLLAAGRRDGSARR